MEHMTDEQQAECRKMLAELEDSSFTAVMIVLMLAMQYHEFVQLVDEEVNVRLFRDEISAA